MKDPKHENEHAVVGGRIRGRRLGPPRSPDLTPPDLFLWGFLKLSIAIRQGSWRTINVIMNMLLLAVTRKLFENLPKKILKRVEACLQEREVSVSSVITHYLALVYCKTYK
jgi:hypothetical protein